MKKKNHSWISLLGIRTLHRMTARAFGISDCSFEGQRRCRNQKQQRIPRHEAALQEYALFTRQQMEKLTREEIPGVRKKLYRESYQLGHWIRTLFLIRSDERAAKVLFRLYQMIGIELEGECPGTVLVNRCYFSSYYTPEMCRIMSAMDQGIFAGIYGGGSMKFTERLTENYDRCRAVFQTGEKEEPERDDD